MKKIAISLVGFLIYIVRGIHLGLWTLYNGKVPHKVFFKVGAIKKDTPAYDFYAPIIDPKQKLSTIGIYNEYLTLKDGFFANFRENASGMPKRKPTSKSGEICFLF
ncbi:MAG: hypothetical protein WCG20_00755 [bacterium]